MTDSWLVFESHSASRRAISAHVCSSVMDVDITSGCGDCFVGRDDEAMFLDDDTASAYTDLQINARCTHCPVLAMAEASHSLCPYSLHVVYRYHSNV